MTRLSIVMVTKKPVRKARPVKARRPQSITGGFQHDKSTFTIQMRGGKVIRSGYAQMWTSPNNGGGGLGSGFGHLRWCADSYRGTSKTFNCQAGDFRVGDTFTNCAN